MKTVSEGVVKTNIVLVGMPGSGKSTTGKILSSKYDLDFIDTDDLVKEACGMELSKFVGLYGQDQFLCIQEKVILGMYVIKSVIATGGSVIYSSKGINHLGHNSIIVYLKLGYQEITQRLDVNRKLARNSEQSLLELYNERTPLYESVADMVVDCSEKSPYSIADEIMTGR
jgi:shikimate kinase